MQPIESVKYITSSANSEVLSYSMTLTDQVVRVVCTHNTCTLVLTLPSVREACGLIFDIQAISVSTATTIQDKGNDAAMSNITLDGANEYVVLYSNGFAWRELVTGYA
jgi:hypothetical protein